jgi:hypothetical protein
MVHIAAKRMRHAPDNVNPCPNSRQAGEVGNRRTLTPLSFLLVKMPAISIPVRDARILRAVHEIGYG